MVQLPFQSADDVARTEARPPWTVSQLASHIKRALTDGLPATVRVVGEVSNLSDRQHWFFSIKDAGATLRCVMFASNARKLRFPVRDGLEIIATGRIDFYDAQGSVQLYVESLEPVGQGALELRLRELAAELRALGWFDPAHRKPLPLLPRRVAVVTSRSGAALQDVINTASRRWVGCQLLLYDVRVQGADAAPQIVEALRRLNKHGRSLGIDAIILTRGGGSLEDLWAFNERTVVEAVFKSELPIVAAIGHETDTTLAELVADVRCATPTQAAMTLIPDRAAIDEQLTQLHRRLTLQLHRRLEVAQHRVRSASRHTLIANPQRLVDRARDQLAVAQRRLRSALPPRLRHANQQLAEQQRRLHSVVPQRLRQQRQQLEAIARHLQAVGPQRVLQRGYTYTLDPQGQPLRSADAARAVKVLTTVFHDGQVQSSPRKADAELLPGPGAGGEAPGTHRKSKPKIRRKPDSSSPSLFS